MTTYSIRAGTASGPCIGPLGTNVGSGIGPVSCASNNYMLDATSMGPPGYRSFELRPASTCSCIYQPSTQPPKPSATATAYGDCMCPLVDYGQGNANQTIGSEMIAYFSLGKCWTLSGADIILRNCSPELSDSNQYFTYEAIGNFYKLKTFNSVSTYKCVSLNNNTSLLQV